MFMLESRSLYAGYVPGRPVLRDFHLHISRGDKVVLMGPNGSGKSTFIKTVLGMVPYDGSVRISGEEVRDMSQEQIVDRAAFLLQVDILEDMRVSTYMELAGVSVDGREDFMDIAPLMNRKFRSLSTGETQRVRLSRVFWSGRPLLLLDEPFAHLDPFYQIRLVNEIRNYPGTILLTLHDVLIALKFFDRHVLMRDGKVISHELTPGSFRETFNIDLQTFL